MSAIDELLEAEVDRVPVDISAGREGVRVRVRARHRRRWAGAAGAVAVVALIGLAAVRVGDDRDQPVITGPGPADLSTTTTGAATTDPTTAPTSTPPADGSPTLAILADPLNLVDGQLVTVTGTGFPPFGINVTLAVCLDATKVASCDSARVIYTGVDENHVFSVPMRLYRDVLDEQWTHCSSCVLRMGWSIGGIAQEAVSQPIAFVGSDDLGPGLRPQLRLDPVDSAITVGAPFTVVATNLQVRQGYNIGLCPSVRVDQAWATRCDFALVTYGVSDAEGHLQITGVVHPDQASVCPEGTPCSLVVDGRAPDEPVLVMTPIDLRRT